MVVCILFVKIDTVNLILKEVLKSGQIQHKGRCFNQLANNSEFFTPNCIKYLRISFMYISYLLH